MSVSAEPAPSIAPITAARLPVGPALVVAVAVLAAIQQRRLGVYTDELWLMTLCSRMLEGARPYVDFLENSPPLAIVLYLPPVLMARVLGVSREGALLAYEIVAFVGALLASWRILIRAGLAESVGPIGAIGAAAALLLLPDYAFGQRDHFVLALCAPLLATFAARADARDISRFAAAFAGAAAAFALAVRPHYAAALAPPFAFVAWRRGLPAAIRAPEAVATVGAFLIFAVSTALLFPAYFSNMLPIVMAVYVPDRVGFAAMAVLPPMVAWAMMAAGFAAQRRAGANDSLSMTVALASGGAILSYFAQGKGMPYHAMFASITMAFALILGARRTASAPAVIAAFVLGLAIIAAGGLDWRPSHLSALEGALLAAVGVVIGAQLVPDGPRARAALGVVGLLFGAAGCAMAATSLHAEWPPHFLFEKQIESLKPHPALAAIGEIGEIAHPLVSRVDGRWTQSVISTAISYDIDRQIARADGDAALVERLQRYKTFDADLFMADMARDPPDALIVDERFLADHFHDPRVVDFVARLKRVDAVTLHEASGRARTFALYVP